jgi:Fe-S cluster biogenesis protein NfuA
MQIDKTKLLTSSEQDPIVSNIIETLEKVAVFVRRDGGEIVFKGFDKQTGIVYVSLLGACQGCMMIDSTISGGVETILQQEVLGVNQVKVIDDDYNLVETKSEYSDWYNY